MESVRLRPILVPLCNQLREIPVVASISVQGTIFLPSPMVGRFLDDEGNIRSPLRKLLGVKEEIMDEERRDHLSLDEKDNLIRFLHKVIRFCVRSLAVLTTLLIVFSVLDVVWVMFRRLSQPPILVLRINDILFIFGALLVVLIAIEIFINITLYLREDVIHVKLVIATALMAIARKVIVLDYREIGYEYVYATAAVVLALGITYSIITGKNTKKIRLKKYNSSSPCESKENQTDTR